MSVSSITAKTPSPTTSAATTATSATTAASASLPDTSTNPSSVLNQTDFLKLLVAQIQYQDPMNPQSDTQMAAQMAQFTTLQQATQSTNSLAMMQANSLIGSTVTVQLDSQHSASGMVTGVIVNNGAPQITINGVNYSLSQVTSVAPTTVNNTGAATGTSSSSSSSSTSSSSTTGDTTDSSSTTSGTTDSGTTNSNS